MTSEPSAGRWKNLKEKRSLACVSKGPDRSLWDGWCGTAPPQMVEEQWDIQAKCDPLSGTHEHQAEEPVDGVLRHHQLTRKHTDSFWSFGEPLGCHECEVSLNIIGCKGHLCSRGGLVLVRDGEMLEVAAILSQFTVSEEVFERVSYSRAAQGAQYSPCEAGCRFFRCWGSSPSVECIKAS